MNRLNKYAIWLIVLVVFISMTSCDHHGHQHHNLIDRINEKSIEFEGSSISSDKHISHLKTIEVTENEITFRIPERKGEIVSYSCTDCHNKPLTQMGGEEIKKAHWNIELNHANSSTLNCTSCHNGENMDHLKSLTGESIDFNNSYKLCAQCHQQEYKDWAGGAHGKRIESWASPRVSMTCVQCHNPHEPHIKSKWPVRFNTQKVKERN